VEEYVHQSGGCSFVSKGIPTELLISQQCTEGQGCQSTAIGKHIKINNKKGILLRYRASNRKLAENKDIIEGPNTIGSWSLWKLPGITQLS